MKIKIFRDKRSFDFKADPEKPDSFENNWKNNSIDWFVLYDNVGKEVFRARCQSVANYCFGAMTPGDTISYGDTVAAGEFKIKLFVEPRNFHGEIHAITETRDIDGQWIDRNAMQTTDGGFQNGRWLIHDRFSFNSGKDTNYAWSGGCIILSSGDLGKLNVILRQNKCLPGDIIPGEIIET